MVRELKTQEDYDKFLGHDLRKIISDTSLCHELVNKGRWDKKELEELEGSKIIFRSFLANVIKKGIYSRIYSKKRIRKMYIKSDFDWTDYNKYITFSNWFYKVKPIEKPIIHHQNF